MEYNFREIEKKWQHYWVENNTYRVQENNEKQKYYVLNMFPYPSGAGLHVGHPLGYIAGDIFARYKRLQGFNVLNPMGYDAYGLPAEQYAIQTGQHPLITTQQNIERYRSQLDKIGFSFDWEREVRTCDPTYYHWTQWTFVKMFESYYDTEKNKALPISLLVEQLEKDGTNNIHAATSDEESISAEEWKAMNEEEQQRFLMHYRIAYQAETKVNWCAALGTVLANDEVVDGLSVRGGHPVVQRNMLQWCLRVSAYAQRLLESLDNLQWTDSIKETQRNWIGRSEGAEVEFRLQSNDLPITVFTTRADTIFGVTFMVLAPESEYVDLVTTDKQRAEVEAYIAETKKRTERERISDRRVSGVFSGSYAINPPIIPLIEGADVSEQSFDAKEGIVMNSPVAELEAELKANGGLILNGLTVKEAIKTTKAYIAQHNLGRVKVNYRLRDATFSRQRYWGEPFPVYYKNGIPYTLPVDCLPLELPTIDKYEPTESGEPPLGRAKLWAWDEKNHQVVDKSLIDNQQVFALELNTMPGFAGSSAYYLRYMDPNNTNELVSSDVVNYWKNVDLYLGGSEHATGHLIYSRFWNKFLFDLGTAKTEEPFERLVNQGMIQGRSNFVYRVKDSDKEAPLFVSLNLKDQYDTTPIHVDVNIVSGDVLDIEAFKAWRPEFKNAQFVLENDKYVCGWAIEKMSKSMFNVVNPDMIVERYGADTLRLYEMFLGPLEQSKPWDTNGIDGCHRFLKKFWGLFFDNRDSDQLAINNEPATKEQLKSVHKLIKKITADIENFSFNTAVSAFMICVNELSQLKCHNKELLEQVVILLNPFAPHISEELWSLLGHTNSVCDAAWPQVNEAYLVEDEQQLTISFNGKARFQMNFAATASSDEIQAITLQDERTIKYIDGKTVVKVIVVPKKIVNIVLKG